MTRRLVSGLAAIAASIAPLAGCGVFEGEDEPDPTPSPSPSQSSSSAPAAPTTSPIDSDLPEPADPAGELDVARSDTREDSYYPHVGEPIVDALHYGLTLSWNPKSSRLSARERLTFRATEKGRRFQLDFAEPLEVGDLTVDGAPAKFREKGKDLVVRHPVRKGREYVLELTYSGKPEPVQVPSTRADMTRGLGWTVTPEGETWTMQEPWGAHTWYAANDHPSDKALYDFTLLVPDPMTGVANGELVAESEAGGITTTSWHLAEPAATYLTTVAFGDFQKTEDRSPSGVPITYWTPRDQPAFIKNLQFTPEAMAWIEKVLGPYPYDTFGTVVVDSDSGMETQTMVTLGDTEYALSKPVIVHELVHQWYGDQVTPADWRDLWLNEGMAMYLQFMWEAESRGQDLDEAMDLYAVQETLMRAEAGPPGAYNRDSFASSNVYYGPALMYHELREKVGDETFFKLVREWPRAHDNGNATREQFFEFWEKGTGQELSAFFDAWLNSPTTPDR